MIFRIHTKGYYLTMRLKDKFSSILKKYVKSLFLHHSDKLLCTYSGSCVHCQLKVIRGRLAFN